MCLSPSTAQDGACRRAVPGEPERLAAVAVTEDFIAGLPKAELHVHHVGSVSQRVVADRASDAARAAV